ncbi:hypothetical protein BGZ83_008561 [Gryganskiella cystojenkinii]|nr:hypothetical protein BGZ83_008561 [Gryganskiella cystojenkinii]
MPRKSRSSPNSSKPTAADTVTRQQVISLTDTPDDNFSSDAIISTIHVSSSTVAGQDRMNKLQRFHDDQVDDDLQLALAISRSVELSENRSRAGSPMTDLTAGGTLTTFWSIAPASSSGGGRKSTTGMTRGKRKRDKNETTVLPVAAVQELIQANVSALLFPEPSNQFRRYGIGEDSEGAQQFTTKTPPWRPSRFTGTTKQDLEISLSQSSEPDLSIPSSSKPETSLWDLSRFKDEEQDQGDDDDAQGIDRLDLSEDAADLATKNNPQEQALVATGRRDPSPVMVREQYVTRFMAQYIHRDNKNTRSSQHNSPTGNDSPSPDIATTNKETDSQPNTDGSSSNQPKVTSADNIHDKKHLFSSPIWSAADSRRISFKDQTDALERDFALSLKKEIMNHLGELEQTIQQAKEAAYDKILESLKRHPITTGLGSLEQEDHVTAEEEEDYSDNINDNPYSFSQDPQYMTGYQQPPSPLLRYTKKIKSSEPEEIGPIVDLSSQDPPNPNLARSPSASPTVPHGRVSIGGFEIPDDVYEPDSYEDYNAGFMDSDLYYPLEEQGGQSSNSHVHEQGSIKGTVLGTKDGEVPGAEDQTVIAILSSPDISFTAGSQSHYNNTMITEAASRSGRVSPVDLDMFPSSIDSGLSSQQTRSQQMPHQDSSPSFSSPGILPPPLDFEKLGYHVAVTPISKVNEPATATTETATKPSDEIAFSSSTSPWAGSTTPKRAGGKTRTVFFQDDEFELDQSQEQLHRGFQSDGSSGDETPPRLPTIPRLIEGTFTPRSRTTLSTPQHHSKSTLPPSTTLRHGSRPQTNPLYGLPLRKEYTQPSPPAAAGGSRQHVSAAAEVSASTSTAPDEEDGYVSAVLNDEGDEDDDEDDVRGGVPATALSQRLDMEISPSLMAVVAAARAAALTPKRGRGGRPKSTNAAAAAPAATLTEGDAAAASNPGTPIQPAGDSNETTAPGTPSADDAQPPEQQLQQQTGKKKTRTALRAEALQAEAARAVANLKSQKQMPDYNAMSLARLKVLTMTFGIKAKNKKVAVEQLMALWEKLNPEGERGNEDADGGDTLAENTGAAITTTTTASSRSDSTSRSASGSNSSSRSSSEDAAGIQVLVGNRRGQVVNNKDVEEDEEEEEEEEKLIRSRRGMAAPVDTRDRQASRSTAVVLADDTSMGLDATVTNTTDFRHDSNSDHDNMTVEDFDQEKYNQIQDDHYYYPDPWEDEVHNNHMYMSENRVRSPSLSPLRPRSFSPPPPVATSTAESVQKPTGSSLSSTSIYRVERDSRVQDPNMTTLGDSGSSSRSGGKSVTSIVEKYTLDEDNDDDDEEDEFSEPMSQDVDVLSDDDEDQGGDEDDVGSEDEGDAPSENVVTPASLERQLADFLSNTPHIRRQYLTYKSQQLAKDAND